MPQPIHPGQTPEEPAAEILARLGIRRRSRWERIVPDRPISLLTQLALICAAGVELWHGRYEWAAFCFIYCGILSTQDDVSRARDTLRAEIHAGQLATVVLLTNMLHAQRETKQ